jgi:hypothetical protein
LFEDPIVSENVKQGDNLSIIVPLINRDTSPTVINLELLLLQNDCTKSIDLGSVSLSGYELKFHTINIDTNEFHLGELASRVEGSSEYRVFRSNYSNIHIVEGITEGESGTNEPTTINALALWRIKDAGSLLEQANELLEKAKERGLDTLNSELVIDKALNLLEKAKEFYAGGNYVAANYYALIAIEKLKEATTCLKELLESY